MNDPDPMLHETVRKNALLKVKSASLSKRIEENCYANNQLSRLLQRLTQSTLITHELLAAYQFDGGARHFPLASCLHQSGSMKSLKRRILLSRVQRGQLMILNPQLHIQRELLCCLPFPWAIWGRWALQGKLSSWMSSRFVTRISSRQVYVFLICIPSHASYLAIPEHQNLQN